MFRTFTLVLILVTLAACGSQEDTGSANRSAATTPMSETAPTPIEPPAIELPAVFVAAVEANKRAVRAFAEQHLPGQKITFGWISHKGGYFHAENEDGPAEFYVGFCPFDGKLRTVRNTSTRRFLFNETLDQRRLRERIKRSDEDLARVDRLDRIATKESNRRMMWRRTHILPGALKVLGR